MKRLIIIGSGGHCRAVLEILSTTSTPQPDLIYDLGKPVLNEHILGIPVLELPSDEQVSISKKETSYILAIGNNFERKKYYIKLIEMGCNLLSVISPLAKISENAKMGNALVIAPFVFVGPNSEIGNNVILNTASVVEHESVIGDHCHLAPRSVICGRVTLGDNSFLGANATIIDKIKVPKNSIIGAGSVIIHTIENEGGTWVGVPARRIIK